MRTGPTPELLDALERWSQVCLDEGWVDQWVEGAIFPREMVFFLASCDAAGVERVVESGRQDGYSTMILGEWADRQGLEAVSIDVEAEPARALRCRERLAGYRRLELLRGDATAEIGRVLARDERPTALLVDGPKGFAAIALLFAATRSRSLVLLGQHNLEPGLPETNALAAALRRPFHYEDLVNGSGDAWQELAKAETTFATDAGAVRSLDHSSLAVALVSDADRGRLPRRVHPRFGFLQPPLVAAAWAAGRYDVPGRLASLRGRARDKLRAVRSR